MAVPEQRQRLSNPGASRIRASERRELEQELRRRVSGEVRFDPFSRVLYSTDASIYQMEPVGVVIPRTARPTCRRPSRWRVRTAFRCCRAQAAPASPARPSTTPS